MNVEQLADDAELVSRWLGRTINNKYVVQQVVGNGGMAVVYAVKHRNGKRFALKMLHRELSLNPFIRQRFVREGYVANRVEHEGAVAVLDDDITDDGSAFLVMDLLHGVTLERLWDANANRLTLECVLAITEQLLDVLAAAHAQNIVHRDLKPANVFVTRNGIVKILDFGIARLREGDGSKTESGTTLGTPLFMPPEQASGRSRDVDARTDLWAVGATIFSLLSGQYVHDGENAAQVLIAVATTPARSLRAVLPDAPADIVTIVDKALAFHNEDRWDSAVAMRAAVLEAQARLSPIVTREELGRIVRATAPGSANADIQSTPITPVTPAPSGPSGTARLPSHPTPTSDRAPGFAAANSNHPLPSMQATKRSEYSPDAGSRDVGDSAARAMTSASDTTPPFRSKSPMLVGLLVVAAVAAIGGALAANRFAGGSGPEPTPSAAPPLASALPTSPAADTATAPPSTASAAPEARDGAETPEDTGSVAASPGQPKLGKISGRKPPRAGVSRPAAGSTPESPTETAAPPPALPTPPTATASPAPTPTPTSRKPPPVLDRTSPFGP